MRIAQFRFLLIVSVLFTGCVVTSLHPVFTEKDVIFEPALLGLWGDSDEQSKESWLFERGGRNQYKLSLTESDGKVTVLDGWLFKLGTNMFLDMQPSEQGLKQAQGLEQYAIWLIPTHLLARVSLKENSLQLAVVSLKWFEEFLKKNPGAIRHERIDDRVVITASTAELQAFIIKHAADKEAFEPSDDVKRTRIPIPSGRPVQPPKVEEKK